MLPERFNINPSVPEYRLFLDFSSHENGIVRAENFSFLIG